MDGAVENDKYWMKLRYSFDDAKGMLQRHRVDTSSSTLLSRGKRTRTFFTSDSHRYMTQLEQDAMLAGLRRYERTGHFDSVQVRYARPSKNAAEILYRKLQAQYSGILDTFKYLPDMLAAHISPVRVWNASIIGAIFFGMFSMTLIYRYLGQSASAESRVILAERASIANESSVLVASSSAVLGVSTDRSEEAKNVPSTVGAASTAPVVQKSGERIRFEAEVTDMVKGYPIEAMLPYILEQDRDVATFLISIGKKESNWGKRVPTLDGHDCYNYWGYRGIRERMGTGGHTCFDSTKDAVETVAKRIKVLVQKEKLNTPAKMIVWKCGSSCAGHSPEGVRKWISDVDMYVKALK